MFVFKRNNKWFVVVNLLWFNICVIGILGKNRYGEKVIFEELMFVNFLELINDLKFNI